MEKLLRSHLAKEIIFILLIFSILAAVFLAILVENYPIFSPDVRISKAIQRDAGEGLLPFMRFISVFGYPLVGMGTVLVTAALFFFFARPVEALFAILTPLASILNVLMKLVVHRPRPTDNLITVYQTLTDASFPSGHVVFYVVFFGFIATTMFVVHKAPRALRIAVVSFSLALILLVSISRVYLGVHWATDVAGGYLTGFVFLSCLLYFYFKHVDLRADKQ